MLGSSTYECLKAAKTTTKEILPMGRSLHLKDLIASYLMIFFELFGDDNNEEYEDFEGFDIEDV